MSRVSLFWPERQEVTGDWRKYTARSFTIYAAGGDNVKDSEMWHLREKKNSYRVLFRNGARQRPLGKPR
jgi:hypothetical protein